MPDESTDPRILPGPEFVEAARQLGQAFARTAFARTQENLRGVMLRFQDAALEAMPAPVAFQDDPGDWGVAGCTCAACRRDREMDRNPCEETAQQELLSYLTLEQKREWEQERRITIPHKNDGWLWRIHNTGMLEQVSPRGDRAYTRGIYPMSDTRGYVNLAYPPSDAVLSLLILLQHSPDLVDEIACGSPVDDERDILQARLEQRRDEMRFITQVRADAGARRRGEIRFEDIRIEPIRYDEVQGFVTEEPPAR